MDFYKHSHGWSNRLIAGDSLLVMNSRLEKEAWPAGFRWSTSTPLRHQVQLQLPALYEQARLKDGRGEVLTPQGLVQEAETSGGLQTMVYGREWTYPKGKGTGEFPLWYR